MNHIQRGQEAEKHAMAYMKSIGFECLYSNLKTPYAEVDLIMRDAFFIYMVEVKTITQTEYMASRVSNKQQSRLLKARLMLQERWQEQIQLVYAFVDSKGKVLLFNGVNGDAF
jgi:Holliday junction resolvase-like predicted endonuclease